MATHSSVLAWRIPGMGEPTGSHRVRHDCSDLAAAAAAARLPGRGRARPPKNLALVLETPSPSRSKPDLSHIRRCPGALAARPPPALRLREPSPGNSQAPSSRPAQVASCAPPWVAASGLPPDSSSSAPEHHRAIPSLDSAGGRSGDEGAGDWGAGAGEALSRRPQREIADARPQPFQRRRW